MALQSEAMEENFEWRQFNRKSSKGKKTLFLFSTYKFCLLTHCSPVHPISFGEEMIYLRKCLRQQKS